jgi:uncharacterized protein
MPASRFRVTFAFQCVFVLAAFLGAAVPVRAQQPPAPAQPRIVVTGEGNVNVAPDYAQVRAGVTTRAKTAREAIDANSKAMAAITAVLVDAGIEQKDIQTSQFWVQPVYASPQPGAEQKLTGFAVSNQVNVTIRQIAKAGDILDRLIAAGATDVGNVEFLHSDLSKTLDQARVAAMADARRKAGVYAQAAGVPLGSVVWMTEESGYAPPPMPMGAMRASGGMAAPVPVAAGEDTLQARITVGFDIAR